MNSRVYLNTTPLNILSIPRSKAWLFTAPILELLHNQASLAALLTTASYVSSLDSEEESDSDDGEFFQRRESDDLLTASFLSTGSGSGSVTGSRKFALARLSSQTDNSSKMVPQYHSPRSSAVDLPRSSAVDLSLMRTSTDEEEETEQDLQDCFFHIAYTPTECTVICSSSGFEKLFRKPLAVCRKLAYDDVVVINKRFFTLQVDNEGQDNGSERILEFTQPLSELGISLFFLSSHFSDIVLIPQSSREQVVEILDLKNFVYLPNTNSYVVDFTRKQPDMDTSTALLSLQKGTRQLLRDAKIRPKIHKSKKCLLTGARPGEVKSSIDNASVCIAAGTVPEYFAITRTASDEISLILPGSSKKRARLGFDSRSIVGLSLDAIIPITVDLSTLPLDSTGIVAGLASCLLESMKESSSEQVTTLEMNYLSMACSAVIMIPEENLDVVTKMVNEISETIE